MHQSDWAFSGGKSWLSDHFGGNDRLIDSEWIKRKALAKKDLVESKEAKKETKESVVARATKRTPSKRTGVSRVKKSKTNSL